MLMSPRAGTGTDLDFGLSSDDQIHQRAQIRLSAHLTKHVDCRLSGSSLEHHDHVLGLARVTRAGNIRQRE